MIKSFVRRGDISVALKLKLPPKRRRILDINKIIDNFKFDEEKVEQLYGGDYKKVALDLAKNNQELTFKILELENKIKEIENEKNN